MKNLILPLLFFLGSITNAAQSPNPICFPETSLRIPVTSLTGITEEEFNRILDKIEKIYVPIAEKAGGSLSISRAWGDDAINAKAWRVFSWWYIKMYGGLARHKEVTGDGFTIVACHELGHHMGGFPKETWYSMEGQSDYYATLKCAHKIWADEDSVAIVQKMNIDPLVREKCTTTLRNDKERAECMRSGMGAKGLTRMLAELENKPMPEINTPDLKRVERTYNGHPKPQCRLDTKFAGALCDVNPEIDIPNDKSDVGVCLFDQLGGRPACWFAEKKPKEPSAALY